jgi:hypothetical protein
MLTPTCCRLLAFGTGASLLAGCAGSSGAPGSPATQGASSLGSARSALAPLAPEAFAERADVGPTGIGKVPSPFVRSGRVKRAKANIACTTVSPSSDVLSGLEEPGSTATAAYVIDTPSGAYRKQNFDGSECDIAVYVTPSASGITIADSTIHDGIRAGLVVDGASNVKISGNALYNVGDHNGSIYAPDGVQYGFAMMLVNAGTGETVATNSVYDYQKDGILAFDNVSLAVNSNDVTGAGAVNYIASNGIEMDGIAFTSFAGNRVSLNQYTGGYYGASGYLVCGDTLGGTPIMSKAQVKNGHNFAQFNDIEIYVSPNSGCS